MAAYVGATVIHRVRVSERRGLGLTACGQRFSLADKRYDPNGSYTEDYADWLDDHRPGQRGPYCLCSHCRDREPAWQRLRRERLRKLRRATLFPALLGLGCT